MSHYIPAPDGATCERFSVPASDSLLYRIHHKNGSVCEYEVTGQAWHSWMIAHRPEVEAIPVGDCMPMEMVNRIITDIGWLVRRLAPERMRISAPQLAREMWESDERVIAFVTKKAERLGRDFWREPTPELRRAYDVAWERDELGLKRQYVRQADRMCIYGCGACQPHGREYYR